MSQSVLPRLLAFYGMTFLIKDASILERPRNWVASKENVLTADTIKYVTDSVDELSGSRFHTVMDVVNELVDQSMIAPRLKEQLREYCQGILEEHSDASDEN